jgi:hypothetical protein
MENLSGCTPTQLLKMINDTKTAHEAVKEEILGHTYKIEELEKLIEDKMGELDMHEKQYVALIEEFNKKLNVIR